MGDARVMISAPASGSGKTAVTCAVLRALQRRGLAVSSCKCGPDYIDPMFHRQVIGAPSRNLDLFLADEAHVRRSLARACREGDVTVIEGAMGYYDGTGVTGETSAWHVARATDTPAVLVIDAGGQALSIAATVAGFARFRTPSQVAGVILNKTSASVAEQYAGVIEAESGVKVLGHLPRVDGAAFESRHLGLVGAAEIADLERRVDALADALERCCDVDALLEMARRAPSLGVPGPVVPPAPAPFRARIAVARDAAFSFYYPDTLEALEAAGAELAYFSPLEDDSLPPDTDGLYLGGGYPELHARRLDENAAMREAIGEAVRSGVPTIAECGGFLYLHETLVDAQGDEWAGVGAIAGRAYPQGRLGRFGYVTLETRQDCLLGAAGTHLRAHEFHYWESEDPGSSCIARKAASTREWPCVHATSTLFAGFPHLYLAADPASVERFVGACASLRAARSRATL